ncbi:MAG: Hpt domain-containing protein [Deltaproteobacteria bacterium]|nr:Hpt domain-containing protein [Deltaproteobacteria bacterium]
MDTSKYKALYLQETSEHLAGIEKGLLDLEKGAQDDQTVDHLFRHYHSIKGMSASMGYEPIQKLAHAQEDLLDRIRQKRMACRPGITAVLFQCLDGLKTLVRQVEDGAPLDADVAHFAAMIKEIIEAPAVAAEPAPDKTAPAAPSAPQTGIPELKLSHVMKVEGRVFDELLATVGDLVMALSTFKTISHSSRSIEFREGTYKLGKYINAIHHSILSARMLPIEDLTEGLPRLVRDMSHRSGKEVELRITGSDLRLDRSTLEGLGGPLVHIIRNCVDHGIEPVEVRVRNGKPKAGVITINAFRKKDRVVIEVADDGAGINVSKIRERAKASGVPAEKLNAMDDKEALMLVCLPGVTSTDAVTETSGRGVGMDVVKAAVEGLGGSLVIASTPGAGVRLSMEMPITTSIIKALIVNEGPEQFLIALSRIERVVEVHKGEIANGWYATGTSRIPVLPLGPTLGMPDAGEREFYSLIIIHAHGVTDDTGGDAAGIRVDAFSDEIDAYIRPLQPPISRLWGVSGIAVMGDGRTVFLLDVSQIGTKVKAWS